MQNPTQQVTSDVYDGLSLRTWSDVRDLSAHHKTGVGTAQIAESPEILVQATSTAFCQRSNEFPTYFQWNSNGIRINIGKWR